MTDTIFSQIDEKVTKAQNQIEGLTARVVILNEMLAFAEVAQNKTTDPGEARESETPAIPTTFGHLHDAQVSLDDLDDQLAILSKTLHGDKVS